MIHEAFNNTECPVPHGLTPSSCVENSIISSVPSIFSTSMAIAKIPDNSNPSYDLRTVICETKAFTEEKFNNLWKHIDPKDNQNSLTVKKNENYRRINMMTHEERWNLAEDMCARMAAKYPEIIVGGVYGSTARATDTPWSDLELLFIIQDESSLESQHFIYCGTSVGYEVIARSELERHLVTPTVKWPYWMGILSVLKVLCGDPELVEAWLNSGKSVPEEKFKKVVEKNLPDFIVESYGRILSCRERNNAYDITCAVLEVLFEMNVVLCLLNRSWVTHDYYYGITESFSFPRLPEDYEDLVSALWSSRTIKEIVPLAERLVKNFWELLKQEEIKIVDYQTPDELPL